MKKGRLSGKVKFAHGDIVNIGEKGRIQMQMCLDLKKLGFLTIVTVFLRVCFVDNRYQSYIHFNAIYVIYTQYIKIMLVNCIRFLGPLPGLLNQTS